MTNPEEDCFNKSLMTLINGQQDVQKQSFNMMLAVTHRHEYENLMRNMPIYDWKNMEPVDWLLQIEKVASLTNSQEYKLATAKSISTSHKMLKILGSNTDWQDIKRKLEEVCSLITTEVHTAGDERG